MVAFIATLKIKAGREAEFERLVPPILDCVDGEMDLQFFDRVG